MLEYQNCMKKIAIKIFDNAKRSINNYYYLYLSKKKKSINLESKKKNISHIWEIVLQALEKKMDYGKIVGEKGENCNCKNMGACYNCKKKKYVRINF